MTTHRARTVAGTNTGSYAPLMRDEDDSIDLLADGTMLDMPDDADDREPDEDRSPEPVYDFPAHRLVKALDSIEKANRRAEKAGIPERFTYEVEKYEKRITDPETGIDRYEERARLTLGRPSVSHDGWKFAGTLAWDDEAGMIARLAPGEKMLERPRERVCDVCGTARDRRDTYVVQRDGVQMQVGSSCLERFMGIRPAGLWMLDFEIVSAGLEGDGFDNGRSPEPRYDARQTLAIGLAVAEKHGWVSRSAAQSYNAAGGNKTATADRVAEVITNKPVNERSVFEYAQIRKRAAQLTAEADELLDMARNTEGDSDYAINMRAIATPDTVTTRNTGMLLSAIAMRQNAREREATQQAQSASVHIGATGDKIADHAVTVDNVRYLEGDFGTTTLVTMRDTDGNVLTWFASGSKEFEVGKTYTVKGTIKKHDEFNDVKQTVLTRAKLEPTDQGAEPEPVVKPEIPKPPPPRRFGDAF